MKKGSSVIQRIVCCFVISILMTACGPRPQPSPAAQQRDDLVDMARARPMPDIVQARFHIKLRSKQLDIAGSTGGGLVVERPGKGYIAILGPLGSPLLTTTSDGASMGVMIAKEKRYLIAPDAEHVLDTTTSGAAGMDDVLALLVGDLPFDTSTISSSEAAEGVGRTVRFDGPSGSTVEVVLRGSDATMHRLSAFDEHNDLVLSAEYGEYQDVDGTWMPQELSLAVPDLDLTVDLRFKAWTFPEAAPDVFTVETPEGMAEESLNAIIGKLVDSALMKSTTE